LPDRGQNKWASPQSRCSSDTPLILVAGDSVTTLIWAGSRGPTGAERAGLALAFGIGAVSLFLFWGSLVAPGSFIVWWAVVPTLVLGGLARLGVEARDASEDDVERHHRPRSGPRSQAFVHWAAMGLIGAEIVYTTLVTLGTDFGWDGLAIWSHRARIAFVSGGVPLSYLTDLSRQWSHLDYPWLVSLGQALFYFIAGSFHEALGKALFPAFYAGLLLVFYANVARLASGLIAGVFTIVLGAYPLLISLTTAGNADVAVSLYWTGSVIYLYRWLSERSTPTLVCSVALAALAAWTKNEGLIFLAFQLAVLLSLVLIGRPRLPARQWILVAGIAALIIAPWLVLRGLYHVPSNDHSSPILATALERVGRLGVIARYTIVELATWKRWGLLWLLFGLSTLSLFLPRVWQDAPSRRRSAYLALSVLVPLGILDAAYMLSRWEPFTDHIENSLDRLIAQQVPVAQFFLAVVLFSAWRRGRPRSFSDAGIS
jgi:hypothetical protein